MDKRDINSEECRDFECFMGYDRDDRIELLQKVVDGVASDSEQSDFASSIEDCVECNCRHLCDTHTEIKQMIKTHIAKKDLPSGLIDNILSRVRSSG